MVRATFLRVSVCAVRELVEVKISGTPERPIFEARPLRSVRAVWNTLFGRGGD